MKSILHPDLRLDDPAYTPNRLLDRVSEHVNAGNDSALAYLLECTPGAITYIRQRKTAIGPWMLVKIMDVTGWHVQTVRALAGIPYDGPRALVEVLDNPLPLRERVGYNYRRPPSARRTRIWACICETLAQA